MPTLCPTSRGRGVLHLLDADELLKALEHDRFVYVGQDGNWYVSRGGGETTEDVVMELVRKGAIRSKYSSIPTMSYWTGRTIDCEATLEARRRLGRKAETIYLPPDIGSVM